MTTTQSRTGMLGPEALLRLEGAAVLFGAVALYWRLGGSGLLFVILLLAPDISMIGYRWNPQMGAAMYNLAHTYVGPALLLVVGLGFGVSSAALVALIWFAHIGLDRLLGYGLKYSTGFKDTHLSRHPYESLSRSGEPRGYYSGGA